MLTYHDVMTTDLSQLTTAAGKWDEMAAEIKKVADRYKDSVQKITIGPSWLGVTAQAAHTNFAATQYEYTAAQAEAKAIASLLRDAHEDFVRLKKNLESKRAEAVKAGMRISEGGVVSYDYDRLTDAERSAIRHDPDSAESIRTAVSSWSEALDACVKAVNDADQGVKIALDAVTKDGYGDKNDETLGIGFNKHAYGDIEKYEAENTVDIATRLNNGDKVSAADMAEFQRAVRDNHQDKAFSQTLLAGLGPDGLSKVTIQMNHLAYDSDKKHKGQYLDIEKNLANTLATATRVPGSVKDAPPGSDAFKKWVKSDEGTFYREWMEGLDKTGGKDYDVEIGNPLYGYQTVVSLMQGADTQFDDQFLYDMGDKLIRAEKQHPAIFEMWSDGHAGIETDAIDGLMGVMSKNPDAATAFFDPAGNGTGPNHVGNDHLKYLVGSGEGSREWPRQTITGMAVLRYDDPTNRMGLGAALEAAATGHVPLGAGQDPWPEARHNEAQARVMNGILEQFAPGKGDGTEASVPKNLQLPVANALAEYASDTHEIISATSSDYIDHWSKGYFTDADGRAHLSSTPKDLIQVMRALSEDPEAYAALHKAEARNLNVLLNEVPHGQVGFESSGRWRDAGAVLGAYTAIREDLVNDERMTEYSEADWKSKVAYHVVGGAITPLTLPVGGKALPIGDMLQRGVDTWAWQWGNEMKGEADAEANAKIADDYLTSTKQINLIVDGWEAGRDDIDTTTKEGQELVRTLKGHIQDSHTTGSAQAQKYLTDTTN
ncbi:hypothetical protein ACFYXM_09115 [Streptomyces sp. NPDC002476]|uniref:hypothetical protein n=1 Tax=Streptomyces sp. NPDC002476 TaxID=3364648 RepID=UPI0036B1590B